MAFCKASNDVFSWPETQMFLKRIGVDTSLSITRLNINLDFDSIPVVEMEYIVKNKGSQLAIWNPPEQSGPGNPGDQKEDWL